ncbi:aldose 1-epimerase family protein [Siphonobacter aquaeclarae]|uniref:Galactose mutarotase n=1 Tax=Siphonobacter aquaeclarae TaxID=563176 RepID=A0A1G9JXA4_9BACT|nr:aldose 1-epimerase family protein [Siphonobacter aquaeclarae]SDL42159.1 protein of unknown function [Siphonobacter aquaeclarae]
MATHSWQSYVSNPAQVGGIETSVLDNGPGRGVRIAWVNTGTGLRYKVVLDRAMDVADAFYNQHSLAWLSHSGVTPPEPFTEERLNWLRTFNGGLITTCGLTHVGGPEKDEFGARGLHGSISNLPAEIESIIQPDLAKGQLTMSLTGRIRETTVFGPSLELKRTISGTLGEAVIRIRDEVTNRGNAPAPHMLLYHVNFGWPLADKDTQIVWHGEWAPREDGFSHRYFREGVDFRTCPAPLDEHSGPGEAAAFIRPEKNAAGWSETGLYNQRLGMAAIVRFRKEQLPWLTNWQHWGRGEYVTGLEPGTHGPIGQAAARREGTLIFLEPCETREYDLEIEVLTDSESIHQFLNPSA